MTLEWDSRPAMQQIRKRTERAIAGGAFQVQGAIKKKLNESGSSNIMSSNERTPSAPGEPPAKGTGQLARSIQVDLSELKENLRVRVGTNLIYARIQEFGGTIYPVKAKALAIPLGREGRRAARQAAGNLRTLDMVLITMKTGQAFLAKPEGGRLNPLFILLPSVILPPRPYVRPAWKGALPGVKKYISETIKGGR